MPWRWTDDHALSSTLSRPKDHWRLGRHAAILQPANGGGGGIKLKKEENSRQQRTMIHSPLTLQCSFRTISYVGVIARYRGCYCNGVNDRSSCWDKSPTSLLLFMR
ncbi:hypothetical protein OPV22_030331 [Ensete ventricosum]|uniref:Uncharacterized protein n=1 Tax=Ensete ventricosum TaxID=4639 RepID=A0AAV8Q9I2_ENSVE|nr:hypothetical protein OPV22_030331 [Ensete ventricosum]